MRVTALVLMSSIASLLAGVALAQGEIHGGVALALITLIGVLGVTFDIVDAH